MWTFIIICIIGFVLFNFLSDKEENLKTIDSQGGLKKKYDTLISRLWDDNSEITRLTRDTICFKVKTKYYLHQFTIFQTFGKVTITWDSKSALSTFSEQWEFLDYEDQEEMANIIIQKMQHRLTSF